MAMWMVEIDRLAGAGWEDWSASVDPWPETEIESVAVNRAGRAQVTFTDPPAIPVHGWLLRVRRGTVSQFVGRIIGLAHRDGGSTIGPRVIVVTATDWDSLLDDDVVPHRYRTVAETAGARIRWLVDTFGTRGITAALPHNQDILAMPGGLDGRPEQEFGPSTLREAIRKVTRISGGSIYVDGDKRLRHFLAENIAAPFGLSDTPNESTTFGYDEFRLDDDDSPRVDEVVVFGAAGIEVTRVVANPPPLAHRRRAPLVDDSLASIAQAEAAGDAFLRANAARRSGSLRTLRSGLGAGMDVQITHQGHGWVARAMRIHGVTTRFDGPDDSPVHQVHFGDPPIDLAEIIGGGTSGVRVVATEASRAVDAVLHQLSVLQAAGANLVVNSSFESVSSQGDWTVGAQWVHGFVPVDPERAFAGTRTARAAPSNTTVGDLTHARVPIDRSADYWLSLWTFMRAWTAGSMAVFVDEFDAAGASLAQTQIATLGTADTAWRRHAIRMGPNDQLGRRAFAAATASIRLRLVGPAAGTFVCDTDGWQIERGTVLTAYAPAPQELRDGQVGTTQIADSSITTPKLTAGSVVAHTIAVGAVLADKIAAGAITADKMAAQIILAGLLATATTGRRVEIDRSGIRCIDENGKTLVNIPTALNAPVSVVGQVETSALTALGSTELRGATTLAVAGTTTATVGLADPTLAPTVSMPTLVTTTPEAVPPRDFGSQGFASGINHDPSGHGGVPTWWLGAQGGDNFNQGPVPIAYEHRVSDGARLRGILMGVIEGAQVVGRYAVGVARAGTRIWVLLSSGRLVAHNQATLAQEVNILHSAIVPIPFNAGLFFDGTHLVIVTVTGTTGTDQLRFRRVNTADGNLHSTLDATGFPVNGDTVILRGGAMRPDPLNGNVNTYWVTVNGVVRAFRMDTGAHVPNREFGEPGRTGSGLTWNGSVFQGWSPDSPHLITTYGDWDWTTESPVYWVGYTWYKSTATTRETRISPRGQLTMGRRRTMRVDNPLIPTGSGEFPDRVRLYMNRGASDPGPGNYRRQVEDALTTRVCPPFNAAGAADPLTNTFPPAVPHEIRSAVQPGWILRGDGTAVLPGGGRFVARTSLLSITVTAETQVIALTMPAGSMQAGTSFRIRALARLSSTTNSTTHTFRCRIGPTTLTGSIAASLGAVRPGVTVANAPFTVDVLVTVRTTGTTGTCIGQIVVLSRSTTPVAFTPSNVISAHSATVAVNTTVQNIVEMTSTGSSTLDTTNFENVTLEAIHPA